MAHGLGADYIEPDVVLTRDGVPVVLHDITLDPTTDVEALFPMRARADGHWYAIDFTLAEIRTLHVHERMTGGSAVFPRRFPPAAALFQVPTLAELIQLVQGLNRSTGRTVGLYPELKAPVFHRAAGQDIARVVTTLLATFGYTAKSDPLYLQCFDPETLKYVRHTLRSQLKLVQLIGESGDAEGSGTDYAAMQTLAGLQRVAAYADGIGPSLKQVLRGDRTPLEPTPLVESAHRAGLTVHPYTVRSDALPSGVADLPELLALLFTKAGVDGVFTDFPDQVAAHLARANGR